MLTTCKSLSSSMRPFVLGVILKKLWTLNCMLSSTTSTFLCSISLYFSSNIISRPDLMVKAMRYYARYECVRGWGGRYVNHFLSLTHPLLISLSFSPRYIVVCLLLARRRVVVELVDELTRHVEEYIKSLKPPDAHEWHVVLQEITSFLQADTILVLPPQPSPSPSSSSSSNSASSQAHAKEEPYYPPPRLDPTLRVLPAHTPYPAHTHQALAQGQAQGALLGPPPITLQQVVLVGNHASQVKFSELTLEMFRMMLALEVDTDVKVCARMDRERL